ncbi:MAG TPA: chemotaxis protein CheC [Smithella sp.]|nr:chemotaxis protein CheC [Smithella sp.]MDM7986392.1 chemotaxis protein CheC [Smithella sp.]HNY51363.1 chemotaxis protein CheC [Smithella sp.]HOG89397.1 chemotaxis protein CheC [Smithella sp.]HOU51065.1 chemotaxis protein CheC [Smithella sp.]
MAKNDDVKEMITTAETDLLQEIMNIAFGRAASDLAEFVDIFVILSVPQIRLLQAFDLPNYINSEIMDYDKDRVSVVEQSFWGKFKGNAFLVFPPGAGKKLISLFDGGTSVLDSDPFQEMEKETFLEIGNILIGACIGKIAELLGDVITYSPPRVVVEKSLHGVVYDNLVDPDNMAIVLRTVFEFNERNVSGFMFILTKQESFVWLKNALHKFLEQYE